MKRTIQNITYIVVYNMKAKATLNNSEEIIKLFFVEFEHTPKPTQQANTYSNSERKTLDLCID